MAAAAIAAAIAGLLIVVFLQQYRDNIDEGGVPTGVLVAQALIERGASVDAISSQGVFKSVKVPKDQLKDGAVTDPAGLRGKIAVGDILPGQQLTAADFKTAGHGLLTKLSADQRAITVTVDQAHGVGGNLRAGDHVDVLSGFVVESDVARPRPVLETLMQDILVLDVPKGASGGTARGANGDNTHVTLRVAARAAPRLAFAADNGKLWLTLRPQNGERLSSSAPVTLQSLLAEGLTAGKGK